MPLLDYCSAVAICESKSEGLVRFPTKLGNSWAVVRCADNAHSSAALQFVLCDASGTWGMDSNQCQCNEGYRMVMANEREYCEGYDIQI